MRERERILLEEISCLSKHLLQCQCNVISVYSVSVPCNHPSMYVYYLYALYVFMVLFIRKRGYWFPVNQSKTM